MTALEARVMARMAERIRSEAYAPDMSGLWPHQADALRFVTSHPGALLYLGMGSGKTRVAVRALERWLPALVITRSGVVEDGVWERELRMRNVDALVLRGSIQNRAATLEARVDAHDAGYCAITNYEGVWREPLASVVRRVPWLTVILDESHHAKAPGSKVSMFVGRHLGRVRNRIGLSGTPMGQGPLDLYGQYRFIDDRIFGTSFQRFRERYAVMGGYEGHQVIGYQRRDELMTKFWQAAFHASPDLGLDTPIDVALSHSLPPSARALYDELDEEFWAAVEGGSVTIANAAVKVLRLQQLASGHIKDDDGRVRTIHDARSALFTEWLDDVDPEEPVIVFARFTHDLAQVAAACRFLGRSYSELSGNAHGLAEWQRGETTVLGVQIQAGGEGIDLTRAALAVYYSVGHSLLDYEQSRARLVRPGQARTVRFAHLSARGTVDTRVYAALARKQQVIESLMKGSYEQ